MRVYQEETGNVQKLYSSWAAFSMRLYDSAGGCSQGCVLVIAVIHSCLQTHEEADCKGHTSVSLTSHRSGFRVRLGFVRPSAAANQDQALRVDPVRPKVGGGGELKKVLRFELIQVCRRGMQRKSTSVCVLPLENEWERERLSCSLFAGDDESTQ